MKTHNQHHTESRQISKGVVASLSHARAASTALRFPSANGENGRTTKRPASQQPAARQPNPNPKRAPRVVAGGTLGAGMDLHFPQFPSIASRRDLPLAGGSVEAAAPASGTDAGSSDGKATEHKTHFGFEHQPLSRDTGIND